MKKFFEKTKKSFIVGIGNITDKDDDNEYLKRVEMLKDIEDMLIEFKKQLNELSQSIKQNGTIAYNLALTFDRAVTENDSCKKDSTSSKSCAEQIKGYCGNASSYVNEIAQATIDEADQILKDIKIICEKRKKNKILLKNGNNELEKAKKKNLDLTLHEEEVEKRTNKFNDYNNKFITNVDELYAKKSEYAEKIYRVTAFYISEIASLIKQVTESTIPQYCPEANKDNYPSSTIQKFTNLKPCDHKNEQKDNPPAQNADEAKQDNEQNVEQQNVEQQQGEEIEQPQQ